ncbi:cytochrome c peroxidase [soil metagenome]
MGNYVRASTYALGLALACISISACSSDDGTTPLDAGTTDSAPDVAIDVATVDAADSGPLLIDGFTAEEWTKLKTMGPLPAVPKDTTNKYADDANAAKLGQMLFFERSYAGAIVVGADGLNGGVGALGEVGKVSCSSCHLGTTMDDDRSTPNNVSLGINYGTRNTLSLVNSAFYSWTNWAGRFDSQWSLPIGVAENPATMNSTRLQVAHMIYAKYKTEYEAIFGPLDADLDPTAAGAARFPAAGKPGQVAWDTGTTGPDQLIVNRIFANYGKALQAYIRLLVSRSSDVDKYVGGTYAALSTNEKEGARLFIGKAKCITCHSGPNMADTNFYSLVVPQTGAHVPAADLGRFTDVAPLLSSAFNTNGVFSDDATTGKLTGLVQDASQKGQFRTKSLRGVGRSAPYMHSGQLATLEAVVDFYDVGGGDPGDAGAVKDSKLTALGLTAPEKANLVAFMKKLDGESVPSALLVNTAK